MEPLKSSVACWIMKIFNFLLNPFNNLKKWSTIFTSDMLKVMEMHVINFDMSNNDISIFLVSFSHCLSFGGFFYTEKRVAWCWVKFYIKHFYVSACLYTCNFCNFSWIYMIILFPSSCVHIFILMLSTCHLKECLATPSVSLLPYLKN